MTERDTTVQRRHSTTSSHRSTFPRIRGLNRNHHHHNGSHHHQHHHHHNNNNNNNDTNHHQTGHTIACNDRERAPGNGISERRSSKSNNSFNNKSSGISDLKEIGLWYGGSLVMNAIVGLGIFGTPKGVLTEVGSVGMTLLIWTFTGIFSMFASLCFVELRESVRKEGVEYAYITEAFGPLAGFVYSWMRIAAAEPTATALFAMVFTNYLTDSIYDECGPPDSLISLISNLAILSMCLVNVMSTKLSQRLQHLATVGKTCALSVIVIMGVQRLVNGKLEIIHQGMHGTKLSQSNLVFACYNGLWAYGGWSQVNHVTSGIKKPPRNVPRVVKTVIPLVLLLYLTVVLSYFTAMTQDDLLSSRAIGVTWAERVLGPAKPIVTIGVCLTALGSLNATFLSAGRLSGVAAKNGQMPDVASWVHVRSKTPLLVVTLKAVVAMVVVCLATIQECLRFYIFCVWLFHGMSILALLVLRYKNKHKLRPYKVDLWIPVVVVVMTIYLLFIPFTQSPDPEFIAVVVLIFLSLVTYYPVKWLKAHSTIRFPDTLTIWLQLFLRIAPKRELRRERRRSMIRRYLALDSMLHPENASKPRPILFNQFASLRYPRTSYHDTKSGLGRQGEEMYPNILRTRRGSSLRASDLKVLTLNSSWSNNASDKPPITTTVRRKKPNRESRSFNSADVMMTNCFPSRPSLPILKNRFNTTPTATKNSEPGALASPWAMQSQELPPSFIYRSYRSAMRSSNENNTSCGETNRSELVTTPSSSEVSSENSIVLQPKALPRYLLQKSEETAADVHHHHHNYTLDYDNISPFWHERKVFFNTGEDDNDDESSTSDDDDDDELNESFGTLRNTIFASIFGSASSSDSSTEDEDEEDVLSTENNNNNESYTHYPQISHTNQGFRDDSSSYVYNMSENNNISRPANIKHRRKNKNRSSRPPKPRQRVSLLKHTRPQPAPRRNSIGTREITPLPQLQLQPQPLPRQRRHNQYELPIDCDGLEVSFV